MEVNEDDKQFNVRQIALPSVSHYPSQPQSMIHWIPIYCTWGETPMEDTAHLWDTCSSIAAGVTTHIHRHTLYTTVWLQDEVAGITVLTCDDKHRKTNACHTYETKCLSTDRECNSEEGNTYSTVPRSPEKVEQKMEGSEYEKVIGCDKEEVKRKGKHYWSILEGGVIMGALCYPLASFTVLFSTHSR